MAEAGTGTDTLSVDTNAHFEVANITARFSDINPVGFGANGLVYSATDRECEKKVAIKKLSFHDQNSCKRGLREIRIMRQMEHENIITVYEILSSDGSELNIESIPNLNDLKSVFVVQELLDTDLNRLVQHRLLTPDHVKFFLYQLLRGTKYIHSANVIHRDLKPSNILINCEDLVLKITDFGLSRVVDPEYSHKGHLTDNVGACWYRSPELIISPKTYTKATDIWSIGCMLAEMLLGKAVFQGTHELDQLLRIIDTVHMTDSDWDQVLGIMPNKMLKNHPLRARTPLRGKLDNIDPAAGDLLERLLTFDESQRITAEDALAHPYLAEYYCPEDEPVAKYPFCIEAEVDDIPVVDLRQTIFNESITTPNRCGTYIGQEVSSEPESNADTEMSEPKREQTRTLSEILHLDSSYDYDCDTSTGQTYSQDRVALRNIRNVQESDPDGAESRTSPDIFNLTENPVPDISQDPWPSENSKCAKPPAEDDEKDVAEVSPRKLEEDLEVGIVSEVSAGEQFASVDQSLCLPLTLDVQDTENLKEFSQPSPKETPTNQSPPSAQQHSNTCNHCGRNTPSPSPVLPSHRHGDSPIVSPSSPDSSHDQDNQNIAHQKKVDMNEKQKLKEQNHALSRKLILDKIQSEKIRSQNQAEGHPDLSSEEFDELYRLPTEHLRKDRDYSNQRLKQKLKTHTTKSRPSKLREDVAGRRRRKDDLVYEGACGGAECIEDSSPQYDSDETAQAIRTPVVESPSVILCPIQPDIDLELQVPQTPPQTNSLRITSLTEAAGHDPLSSPEAPSSPRSARSGARPKKSPRKQRAL